MKFFEIIFILLLMLPVALLMRYLVTRLTVLRPMQARVHEERKPSRERPGKKKDKDSKKQPGRKERKDRKKAGRTRKEKDAPEDVKQDNSRSAAYWNEEVGRRPGDPDSRKGSPKQASDFTPRPHSIQKRTARIPFSEIYSQMDPAEQKRSDRTRRK